MKLDEGAELERDKSAYDPNRNDEDDDDEALLLEYLFVVDVADVNC